MRNATSELSTWLDANRPLLAELRDLLNAYLSQVPYRPALRRCECGTALTGKQTYCSVACRQRAYRKRHPKEAVQ